MQKHHNKDIKSKNHKYRIDITNDDTYSHLLTVHISSKNFVGLLIVFFIGIITFTISVIVFSPLKYYVPGLDYVKQRNKVQSLKIIIDSLQNKVEKQDKLYNVLQLVVKDDLKQIKKFDSLFFENYPNETIKEENP